MRTTLARFTLALALSMAGASAQTTQGLISGQVFDRNSGLFIACAKVSYESLTTGENATADTDSKGMFVFVNLSPGSYQLNVEAAGYQRSESSRFSLRVAGAVDVDVPLRPAADVYDQHGYFNGLVSSSGRHGTSRDSEGRVIHFYAADVETKKSAFLPVPDSESGTFQAAVSYVINRELMDSLPLLGRDVYATLAIIAGVSADAPTSRSLGLAANGQRPSSSNFLLDGVENNNYLITGPLHTLAPETVQEYRISTNSFSPEYGKTSGYLANAITRRGESSWRGTLYVNFRNEALNANDFQRNLKGIGRTPVKEWQTGLFAGGPFVPNRWFVSGSLEWLRFRSRLEPNTFRLPSAGFQAPSGTQAAALLGKYARPMASSTACSGTCADVVLAPPSSVNRFLALPRVDYASAGGKQHAFARWALARYSKPDFVWSPYKDFTMPLTQNTNSVMGSWSGAAGGGWLGELRAGWNLDDLRFDRPHPEVPFLTSSDDTILPGSPTFYSYRNRSRGVELSGGMTKSIGAHLFKAGGGLLARRVEGYLTAARDGQLIFDSLGFFANDSPRRGFASASRLEWRAGNRVQPDYNRLWNYNQFFFYAQDSYRLARRLMVNLGFRYDSFGSPQAQPGSGQDAVIELGSGNFLPLRQRLPGAHLAAAGPGALYRADGRNGAVRLGVSYGLRDDAKTVLRAGYGTYYDRPFDNLWQNLRNNNNLFADFVPSASFPYLGAGGAASWLNLAPRATDNTDVAQIVLYNPDIRTPRVRNYFASLQHQIRESWVVELTALGSSGINLVTTDIVNRAFSTSGPGFGRLAPSLPNLSYRSGDGELSYHGVTAVSRYQTQNAYLQLSYTLSHAIDNQSEPLAGDFFDLRFIAGSAAQNERKAAFTEQFNPAVDRINSDFDQRQNLSILSVWNLPGLPWAANRWTGLFRNWRAAQLAAFRSGQPFTVTLPVDPDVPLLNNRPMLVKPDATFAKQAIVGGELLLNKAAFDYPADGKIGNLGRNSLRGPGFFSLDVSLSRSIALHRLGRDARAVIRADAFNVLNHVNLNTPSGLYGFRSFGEAKYGRLGRNTGFPAQAPFAETARQIQLLLRFEF